MPKGYRKDGRVGHPNQGNRKPPPPPGRGRAKNPRGLNDRHLRVIDEYERLNFSSQKAALAAVGYSEGTHPATVFSRPDVIEEIEKRRERRRRKLEMTEDVLVQRIMWLISANAGEIIQKLEENSYDLSVLTEEEKYAVQELADITVEDSNGKSTRKTRIKLVSRLDAIDKAMRKLGLYKDKMEVTAPGMSVEELLQKGRQRVAQSQEAQNADVSSDD